jgi:hypothetical protein
MGVVYETFDHDRRELVAAKTMLHFSPANLYRFKQEFRTLADVVHPNLVRLHELVASGGESVFFTMELVRGTTFRRHVRASVEGGGQETDFARLRSSLRQLAEGLQALHAAGKLHRDIKPSNVLVTTEGRVVILDFGVATELGRPGASGPAPRSDEVVGTDVYMAPEQAAGAPPTAASDWYSVGVMLYEALVGQPPFTGSSADVLARKSAMDAQPASATTSGIPDDLDALCSDLLRRDAGARPSGREILGRLPRSSAPPRATPPPAWPPADVPLVGRERHLAALRTALEEARAGRCVTVLVHGASGMGKTALVRAFIDTLEETGQAAVLRGRVHQRESMPYRAFDGVVDALRRKLMALDASTTEPVSEEVAALARLFPVLHGVTPVDTAADWTTAGPNEVRLKAFHALRSLLAWMAQSGPLIVHVDDVHWGDVDSVGLLFEAVRPPSAGPLLLVLSYQDESATLSPFLRETRGRWPRGAELRELEVGPLDPDDARSLSAALVALDGGVPLEEAETIGRESGGSPFLIEELVRSVSTGESARTQTRSFPRANATLGTMVQARLARLDPPSRRLVEVIAVAGRPLAAAALGLAAGVQEWADPVQQLHARRFVRTGIREGQDIVEISHGRIADTILSSLSRAAIADCHGRLARTLESLPAVDAEAIAQHLLGAGDRTGAVPWVERAAEQAATNLAFDQAVRLFRLAVDLCQEVAPGSPRLEVLRMRLGEVDACLSPADLEGPLKEQVEDLLRSQAEVEAEERQVASWGERIDGYRRRIDELRAQAGDAGDGPPPQELRDVQLRLSLATREADTAAARLRKARERLQQGVADLSLDPASDEEERP